MRNVDALLQAWSLAPPTVLRSGGLGVRDLARTAALLDLDEAHTAVVVETAYAAGLLAADGEVDEAWCPTPAYDIWAARPGAEQWTLLAQAWLAMTRTPALDNERDASGSRVNVLSREAERSGTPDARRSASRRSPGCRSARHRYAPTSWRCWSGSGPAADHRCGGWCPRRRWRRPNSSA